MEMKSFVVAHQTIMDANAKPAARELHGRPAGRAGEGRVR
jgi:hypothetical protein